MSLTNNTGSRVTSNEEPLTGQSGPVNLASKMAPKEKTNSKEKRKRRDDERRENTRAREEKTNSKDKEKKSQRKLK